ncbi:MAG TPA: tryptophan synthase subunit alpha [Symbiobacteriaceae bacterium]|nr:tryptophan synthase subunit alpha [Symbiobacteriaceae bacterium]
MSRISVRFAVLKQRQEKALVAYIAAGDPSLEATPELIKALEAGGADLVELGLAFSDPLADGPTIQAGSQRALAAGANTDNVLGMIAQVRRDGVQVPLLIMTYYNLLLRPGVANFCRRAAEAGVDGLIIPDVPMEEADELLEATRAAGLDLVQFVAPTSTPDRIERAARLASGFVYCVSLTGVTGERAALPPRFKELVTETKRHTETPVCVGFGISRPEQVREVCAIADGVIVGSAIVRLCGEGGDVAEKVRTYVSELKAATK